MDQRKIIKFGKSSSIISLPRKWLQQNSLSFGDFVFISEMGPNLMIMPDEKKEKKKRRHDSSSSEGDRERKTIENKDSRRENSVEKRRGKLEPKPSHRSDSRDKLGERGPYDRREKSRSRDRKRHRHHYKDEHDRIRRDDKKPRYRNRRSPSGSKSSSSFLSD